MEPQYEYSNLPEDQAAEFKAELEALLAKYSATFTTTNLTDGTLGSKVIVLKKTEVAKVEPVVSPLSDEMTNESTDVPTETAE